jgi:hypothetical protein
MYGLASFVPAVSVVLVDHLNYCGGNSPELENISNPGISVEDFLEVWIDWRLSALASGELPPHDAVMVLTAKRFVGPDRTTLGLASLGSVCDDTTACGELDNNFCYADGSCCIENAIAFSSTGGINQSKPSEQRYFASIFTHELGHLLGLEHDEDYGCVQNAGIMKISSTSDDTLFWTACSQTAFEGVVDNELAVAKHPLRCLLDGGSVCGNGIVEFGEACENPDPCCNATTCQLKENATCSARKGCCNPETCVPRLASSNYTCRAAVGPCDMKETCDGNGTCPEDNVTPRGMV